MVIILDFDDVLLNTKRFREDFKKTFKKHGVSDELFDSTYYDKHNNFGNVIKEYSLNSQLKRISEVIQFPKEALLEDIKFLLINTKDYLFEDSVDFLKKQGKKQTYLLSMPNTEFQKQKIKNSDIQLFVNKIILVEHYKSEGIKQIKKDLSGEEILYFVDDRVEQLENVKIKHPDVVTILLKRDERRYFDQKNSYCDYEANNLAEVSEIIEEYKKGKTRHNQ